VGICGTDLHAYRGKQPFFSYPRILGHELGVEVLEAAPGSGLAAGDRCSVNPYFHCGDCAACRLGRTNCCEKLRVYGVHVDGGMRQEVILPAAQLYKSATLTLEQLALIETLGIGAHAVNRARLEPGESALVIGAGPIGLSVLEFLRVAQADCWLLELSEPRRAFVERHFPEVRMFEPGVSEPPRVLFDCTGNPQSMMASFGLAGQGGRIVFVGLFLGDVTFHDPEFHRKELTLMSSRNATAAEHRRIMELVESGRIDTRPWISDLVPVEAMIQRFPHWLDPENGVVKAMVEF
jgi:threonine dehydrogenase-like Zn-dependent dehydrogenase